MSRPSTTPARLALAARVVAGCLLLSVVVLLALIRTDSSYAPSTSLLSSLPDLAITASFLLAGLFVTWKRPENLVGWALLLSGGGMLLGGMLSAYAELALLAKPQAGLPAGAAAGAGAAASWVPLMAGVFLMLLVFPAGMLPTRALRRFAVLVLVGFLAVWAMLSTAPGKLAAPLEAYENPLAPTTSKAYVAVAIPIIVSCLGSILVAAGIAVRRFRRSHGQEREQFKWLAASAGLLIVTLPFAAAFNWSRIAGAVFTLQLIALPVSVGIAVLRYRLYEIDIIVRRTLVYSTLTALLAGTYVVVVIGLQALFSPFTGGSNLAIAGSTLVVAALFMPVRSRVQHFVDRRFYRRRYDAQRTLETFGARLREQVDLETLGGELCVAVDETMQPAHVGLWLREAGQ
jgi:hypothetical protein